MTEPLYREDAYLIDCTARVVSAGEGAVVLDRTVFYPKGGGQPGDTGRLVWEGGEAAVVDTLPGEAGVAHRLAEGAAMPPEGAEITAKIDAGRRLSHMRVHTGLHLLSVVIPLPVTGGQISEGKGRLDFDMPEAPEDKAALEARLAELIAADHPVSSEWITDEELAANPALVKTMSVKPPTGQGRVRLVRIGEGAGTVDLQPCGGTHVRSTGEIGAVRLGKIEKKGRQNRRVTLLLAD
jgi:misacylated tRNA(Ala) deacylase